MSLVSEFIRNNLQQISYQQLQQTQQQFQASNELIDKLAQIRQEREHLNYKNGRIRQKIQKIERYLCLKEQLSNVCENQHNTETFEKMIQIFLKENPIKKMVILQKERVGRLMVHKLRNILGKEFNDRVFQRQLNEYLNLLEKLRDNKKVSREFLINSSVIDSQLEEKIIMVNRSILEFNSQVQIIITKIVQYERQVMNGLAQILNSDQVANIQVTPMKHIDNQQNEDPIIDKWNITPNLSSHQEIHDRLYSQQDFHPYHQRHILTEYNPWHR